MACVNRYDAVPRANLSQIVRGWWSEVTTAPRVFCWRQPFRPNLVGDRLSGTTRGVVLVHGFVCNRGLWNPWLTRLRERAAPVVAVNLEPIFGSIDSYPAAIEAAVGQIERATRQAPIIVAHSMGGLAVRAWLDRFQAMARVHRVITIGTPHHGTWLARFALTRNGREMRLGSAWLISLAARESDALRRRFTCFYGHCDNIVFPASSATLAGADNRHLEATAHVAMTYHPAVFGELMRWLDGTDAPAVPASTVSMLRVVR
jgi:triacylglycerol esterase/lipase EstA (alpha/beta hydrolase family)